MSSTPQDNLNEVLKELKEDLHRKLRNHALGVIYSPGVAEMAILTALQVDRKTLLVDILREIADELQETKTDIKD